MSFPNRGPEGTDLATSEVPSRDSSNTDVNGHGPEAFNEHAPRTRQPSVAARIRNPLAGKSEESVLADVDTFVEEKGLTEHREVFRKGALIARVGQRADGFENISSLTAEEKDLLRHEVTHRWSHPFMLYFLVVLCAGSAIVQGMDQTAVNGAQVCSLADLLVVSNVSVDFLLP